MRTIRVNDRRKRSLVAGVSIAILLANLVQLVPGRQTLEQVRATRVIAEAIVPTPVPTPHIRVAARAAPSKVALQKPVATASPERKPPIHNPPAQLPPILRFAPQQEGTGGTPEVLAAIDLAAAEFSRDRALMVDIGKCESGLRFWPVEEVKFGGLFQQSKKYWHGRVEKFNKQYDPDVSAEIHDPTSNARVTAWMMTWPEWQKHWPRCHDGKA